MDTGMITYGVQDTMKALEMSALTKFILYEDIQITRYEVNNPVSGE